MNESVESKRCFNGVESLVRQILVKGDGKQFELVNVVLLENPGLDRWDL